jgi:hypothetical protein
LVPALGHLRAGRAGLMRARMTMSEHPVGRPAPCRPDVCRISVKSVGSALSVDDRYGKFHPQSEFPARETSPGGTDVRYHNASCWRSRWSRRGRRYWLRDPAHGRAGRRDDRGWLQSASPRLASAARSARPRLRRTSSVVNPTAPKSGS